MRLGERLLVTTALAAALLVSSPASALPVGGVVSAGNAAINTSGNATTVSQSSARAVIDWSSFNVGGNESVNFVQPSSSSIALNRIGGNSASDIQGSINANGQVWLINPNGIVFGGGAQVNVAGLVATSSNISNTNFMAGNYTFDTPGNPNASVSNAGSITVAQAGMAALVAPTVTNSGTITARLGNVTLASGDTFTLDTYGDGLVSLAVSPAVRSQLVQNSGAIVADGGTVTLTAAAGEQVVNSLINTAGLIQADAVGQQNGSIVLYAEGSNAVPGNVAANKGQTAGASTVLVSGILDASGYAPGQTGGNITVTGDNVGILSGAIIDASGDVGGGNIKIGGDFHGAGTTPTALNTYVDPNALILANANTSGNGGNVAVWSDGNTWFYGNILAEGGQQSGNGGFVETSGHGYLDAEGYVDLLALNGTKGTYLLDPATIEIYGGVTPAFNATDGSIQLASALQLWLDASNTANITLSYNDLSTTATGSSGQNTITVGSNTGLVVGERIQIGTSASQLASVNDTSNIYTITAISGTTVTLDANLASSASGSEIYGGYVKQLNDLSGNGNNATQTTASSMPLWVNNGQNGLGVASFNGTSDVLTTASQILSSTSNATLSLSGTTAVTRGEDGYGNGWSIALGNSLFNTVMAGSEQSANVPSPTSNVISAELTQNSPSVGESTLLFRLGSNPGSTLTFGQTGLRSSTVGWNIGISNTTYVSGNLNEFILYSSSLSNHALDIIDQYQSAKWGIALTGPGNATGESGLTGAEAQAAMASTQLGATTDGYSVFADTYLERLSQTSNIILAASGNVTIDLQGDNMALAAGRNLSITSTAGSISNNSAGTITTSQSGASGGNITFSAGTGITLSGLTLNSNGGNITLTADTASGGGANNIDGNFNSSGGTIAFNGAVLLNSSLSINAGSGSVSFGSTVDAQNITAPTDVSVLVVGGGGGGGNNGGGGGGGGGVVYDSSYGVTANSAINVTVGGGGLGSVNAVAGGSGGNSIFGTITAVGGGGGASRDGGGAALSGGSGGGGSSNGSNSGGAGTAMQGNNGGNGASFGADSAGGGGGGAGGAGTAGVFDQGGNGGGGIANSITGSSVTYAGGGAGGVTVNGSPGTAGNGGGGSQGGNGTNGLGGGGGGGGPVGYGGIGGSGVVMVEYTGTAAQVSATGGTASTSNGNTIWTFSSGSGTFTPITAGCSSGCNLTITAGSVSLGGAIGSTTALGNVAITSGSSLTLPSITATDVTAVTTGAAADITLASGTAITASGSGYAITLASGRNFINDSGSNSPLSTGSGHWRVYSTQASGDTDGASVMNPTTTVNGITYPTTTGESGNTWFYANNPLTNEGTVDIMAGAVSATYGTVLSTLSYSCSGNAMVCGALGTYLSGALGVANENSSTVAAGTVLSHANGFDVASGPFAILQNTLTWAAGYTGTIDYTSAGLTLTRKALTDTGFAVSGRTYNGLTNAAISSNGALTAGGTTSGDGDYITGDTVAIAGGGTASFGSRNAGLETATGSLTLSGAQAADYTLTAPTATATIAQEALTVTAAANTKTYDGTTAAAATPTLAAGSIMTGDTANFGETYANKNAGTGLTLTPSGTVADGNGGNNYTYTYDTSAAGIINPASLTVMAMNLRQSIGSPLPPLTYTISGFQGSDTQVNSLTGSPYLSVSAYNATAFGASPIAITQGTLANLASQNYSFSFVNAVLTVPNALPDSVQATINNNQGGSMVALRNDTINLHLCTNKGSCSGTPDLLMNAFYSAGANE